jgi:hypothetical protein
MNHETIRLGQTTITFPLAAEETNGSVALFDFTVPGPSQSFGAGGTCKNKIVVTTARKRLPS